MINILEEKYSDKLSARNVILLNYLYRDFKDKTILDIGCGFGWLEYRLKDKVKKIIGVDINKDHIKKAKKEIISKNVTLLVGSALRLPIKSNSIDVVVASEVIEHLPKGGE